MDTTRKRLPFADIPGGSDDAILESEVSLIANSILAGQMPPVPVQCPPDLQVFQPLFIQKDAFEPYVGFSAWTALLLACAKYPTLVPYLREQEDSVLRKVAQGIKAKTRTRAQEIFKPNR